MAKLANQSDCLIKPYSQNFKIPKLKLVIGGMTIIRKNPHSAPSNLPQNEFDLRIDIQNMAA